MTTGTHYTEHERFADQADDYLDKHNIYELFSFMLKKLAIHKPKDPLSFMISLLDQPVHTLRLLVAGPPEAGVDIQINKIIQEYGIIHLKLSAILQEEISSYTELGAQAKSYLELKQNVPDEIVIPLIHARVNKSDCVNHGWILEGYPFTQSQASALQVAGILPTHLLHFQTSIHNSSSSSTTTSTTSSSYEKYISGLLSQFPPEQILTIDSSPHRTPSSIFQDTKRLLSLSSSANITYAPRRPLKICICGCRGIGKSIQSERISKKYGLIHIRVSELIRIEMKKNERMRMLLQPYIDMGTLIPDDIVTSLVCERLQLSDARRCGWILDGYPRTLEQARMFSQRYTNPSRVIFLNDNHNDSNNNTTNNNNDDDTEKKTNTIDDDGDDENSNNKKNVCMERCIYRRRDIRNGCIYDIRVNKEKNEDVDENIVYDHRDKIEYMKNAIHCYRENERDLKHFYRDIVLDVNGDQPVERVYEIIENFLVAPLDRGTAK